MYECICIWLLFTLLLNNVLALIGCKLIYYEQRQVNTKATTSILGEVLINTVLNV